MGNAADKQVTVDSTSLEPSEPAIERTRVTHRKGSKWLQKIKSPDEFDGRKGFSLSDWKFYQRPTRPYLRASISETEKLGSRDISDQTEYYHRDIYGHVTWRKRDVLRYISPTYGAPRRAIIQATPEVLKHDPPGDWRRKKIEGNVPTLLKLAEWALPGTRGRSSPASVVLSIFITPFVALAILFMLSLPISKAWEDEFQETYTDFPNYYWDYPKYARNSMDMQPEQKTTDIEARKVEHNKNRSYKIRLLRPRKLVVLKDGQWQVDSNPQAQIPYIFISFTGEHFRPSRLGENMSTKPEADRTRAEHDRLLMEKIARAEAEKAGVTAYWWEPDCCAPVSEPEEHNADVYRMCDLVRGAQRTVVVLPDMSFRSKLEWGSRVWTFPEALLSTDRVIYFSSPDARDTKTKLQLTDDVWNDSYEASSEDDQPTRLLVEHFSGVLTLSRLELFSVALEALSRKKRSSFFKADLAYALMGLMNHRIQLTGNESLFEGLARLSLANDSDHLVERMICMFPDPEKLPMTPHDNDHIFRTLIEPDQYDTRLWDIEHLCQVAGIGKEGEIILDGCKGVSIRWKGFPQMKYRRSSSFRRLMAELVLRSGGYFFVLGLGLIIGYGIEYETLDPLSRNESPEGERALILIALGVLAFLFSLLLAPIAPFAVRRIYGGRVTEAAPWLVGFEGVMPIAELEKIIFGNIIDRLSYKPSSTPFCDRDPEERLGREPRWIANYRGVGESASGASTVPQDQHGVDAPPRIPKHHRLFTLVDTGALSVSIFSAERPPSVALLCGREGGMLRTVLCHYERSNNCLYKETVMRMESTTLNQAKQLSWIKLNLGRNVPQKL